MFYTTAIFLLFSKDKKWKNPPDDPGDAMSLETEKKTIIFVRHGESTWNDTFNKGDRSKSSFLLGFIPNLIYALFVETYFFITCQDNESWFFDSPLSKKGVGQACSLRQFLLNTKQGKAQTTAAEEKIINILLAETDDKTKKPSSQLVTSNLRRAITTIVLGFQDRLEKKLPDDNILMMTDLQEISFNPDASCITPKGGTVVSSFADRDIMKRKDFSIDLRKVYSEQISSKEYHRGNKELESNGLKRMTNFNTNIFSEYFKEKDAIICAGHSLWFRSFFRTFLPYSIDHVAKKKKIVNGGVVSFTLHKVIGDEKYFIDPESIQVIYAGF